MVKRRKKRKIAKRMPQKSSSFSRLFRRGSRRGRREKKAILPDEIRPWILGISLIVAAIFTILSFFDLTALAGRGFLKIFGFFMGEAIFMAPLILALGGFSCFFSRGRNRWSIVIAIILLSIGTSGVLGLFDLSRGHDLGFRFFYAGRGGCLGNISAWPLMKVFGFWFALIILLSLIIISGLIFWFFIHSSRKKGESAREDEEDEFGALEEIEELRKPLIRRVFAPRFQVSKVEDKKESAKKKDDEGEEEIKEPESLSPVAQPAIQPVMGSDSAIMDWKLPSLDGRVVTIISSTCWRTQRALASNSLISIMILSQPGLDRAPWAIAQPPSPLP